jgi:hypothetical protein
MKTTISGKNPIKEMKALAKDYFAEYGNPSCVCIGVALPGKANSSGRATDAFTRTAYVGISGVTGLDLLRDTLNAAGHGDGKLTRAHITANLTTMANQQLVKYRSKLSGPEIKKVEDWNTHNCAESKLALYLLMNGIRSNVITIASYEIVGSSVRYKALCKQCAQWVRQNFKVLDDYDSNVAKA